MSVIKCARTKFLPPVFPRFGASYLPLSNRKTLKDREKLSGYRIRLTRINPDALVVSVTGLEPDFVYPLENVTIPQGRDATFTCVVNNLGGYRVSPSSSASGDHSGSAKARVTILPLNLCPPVMDYYLIYY